MIGTMPDNGGMSWGNGFSPEQGEAVSQPDGFAFSDNGPASNNRSTDSSSIHNGSGDNSSNGSSSAVTIPDNRGMAWGNGFRPEQGKEPSPGEDFHHGEGPRQFERKTGFSLDNTDNKRMPADHDRRRPSDGHSRELSGHHRS